MNVGIMSLTRSGNPRIPTRTAPLKAGCPVRVYSNHGDITYSKENVGPRARRVGDHAAYIVDRLNNAGLSEDAMVILRHSVDGRVTPEQYEARIAERKRMEA
jgi:hypothetical protein